MEPDSARNLAKEWIAYQKLPRRQQARSDEFTAWNRLYELVGDQPEDAWQVIIHMLAITPDDNELMLAVIAAGPVEGLLAKHGASFIERIENLARADAVAKKMLGAVWRSTISEDVWRRLEKVAGPSF